MSLSSIYLDAFFEVCRTRNFSEAASHLGITQSALSQRIMNLEAELGATLLLREKGNVTTTAFGEKLLSYCQLRSGLEQELLSELKNGAKSIQGELRIAGFSSIMRSVVIPSLRKLLATHPGIQLELATRELRELPELLRSGEAHFIFYDRPLEKNGITSVLVGHEESVLITSATASAPEIYIDHDKEDAATFDYLKANKVKTSNLRRIFFDEIYALIDAVELGMGRAVVSKHLIESNKKVKVVPGFKPHRTPVYLCYKEQPFYTELQKSFLGLDFLIGQ